jgi:excisionase family DNA binding protein
MTTTKQSVHSTPPIAVSPDEAARLAGIGRTSLYAALAKGDLKSIKIGTRRLIKIEAIHEWLASYQTDTE